MPLDNEQIEAMANWTLEDVQKDALAAIEQVQVLAASYLDLRNERDAAVQDLTYAAKASAAYESSCALCAGGLGGGGGCDWPVDVDMPVDGCEKCGKCRCAWCAERSEWTWDMTRRARQEAGYGR